MKIGYFADGPWSHDALEKLVALDGVEILFITPRFDTQDPVLKQWAEKLDVPFLPHENVNAKDFLDTVAAFNADIFVSMSFNQILRSDIINMPPRGFINCHAGALPFYRGRNPLNWALINGENEFGITVHYVDEGIDTGDIIHQQMFPISMEDDYGSLLKLAFSECANVLIKAVMLCRDNQVKAIKQETIHPVGLYCGMRRQGDEILDFNSSSVNIFNFIRAISNPGPCARVFLQDKEYAIVSSELIDQAPNYIATIGEVVGRNEKGVVIKTQDSTILVTAVSTVLDDGSLSEPACPRFRIGSRFKPSREMQS